MSEPLLASTSDPEAPDGIGWHEFVVPGAPFAVARLTVEPGHATPIDSHAVTELWMVAQGRGELRYDGRDGIRIGAGDAVRFVPPRTHQLINDGPETVVVHSVYWQERP
ncbi:cupin domain-containing protein [Actinoplanes sp. NPDC049548]|uniref:cupin domain-containing protein n=1 Tax=Actinoplanes sp. NPDC049548 TaxID=3155152 RepID=UPI00341B36B8